MHRLTHNRGPLVWADDYLTNSRFSVKLNIMEVEELSDLQLLKYSVTAYDSRAVIYSKIWSGFESELI